MEIKIFNLEELSYKDKQEINGGIILALAFMVACFGIFCGVVVADIIQN